MGMFEKLFGGLGKTRQKLDLEELFQDYAPDSEDFYEELEEMLVLADAGVATAERVDYLMRRKTWEDRFRKGEEAREATMSRMAPGRPDSDSDRPVGRRESGTEAGNETVRDSDGRRQRRRENDHHRQAGPPAEG